MIGNWDASGALTTKPAKTGTVLPATCSTGEAFFNIAATGGQNFYLCKPDNTWTQVSTGGSSPTLKALVFDGSTAVSGETMSAWSCGSGSGATCTTQWTVPSGVTWVRVQAWSGGSGGQGSSGGDRGGQGGGGGGWDEVICGVTPGNAYVVTVGLGGSGGTNGYGVGAGVGGNSGFGNCFSVVGASGANEGYLNGLGNKYPGDWELISMCTGVGTDAYSYANRVDQGGCGGGCNVSSGQRGFLAGSTAMGGGGGGGGAFNSDTYAPGGTSVYGGAGGHGGAWTSGTGLTACTAGSIPGGGGGGAGVATSGNKTGCAGARGEVRIYYIH